MSRLEKATEDFTVMGEATLGQWIAREVSLGEGLSATDLLGLQDKAMPNSDTVSPTCRGLQSSRSEPLSNSGLPGSFPHPLITQWEEREWRLSKPNPRYGAKPPILSPAFLLLLKFIIQPRHVPSAVQSRDSRTQRTLSWVYYVLAANTGAVLSPPVSRTFPPHFLFQQTLDWFLLHKAAGSFI